ncbi:MAG: glycerophosphoryl diester phosphodiesterase [Chloroflexota bacterium]|nr:glycerophosphoryl diester phosphodiesterase [Chloroflexota bacterium]
MDWTTPGLGLRIGGHRGAAHEAPENTFAGFALAAGAGVDYLELDVQLAADGVALVFHDDELDRTTDGAGPFTAHSSAELLRLDAGAWFGRAFGGERIPTLDGFLAWLVARPGLGATIEAKGTGTGAPIARAIAANANRRDCSICSFSADELRAAAAVDPLILRMLIVDRDDPDADLVAIAIAARAGAVNVPIDWLTREIVDELHAAGLLVAGGTVDDEARIATCLGLGIDLVDTNRPSVAVPARDAAIRRESAGG